MGEKKITLELKNGFWVPKWEKNRGLDISVKAFSARVSVEPMRKVTFRMGSIELSRKVLVRAPFFFNFSRRKYVELLRNRLFARVLRGTVAKSPAFTIFF